MEEDWLPHSEDMSLLLTVMFYERNLKLSHKLLMFYIKVCKTDMAPVITMKWHLSNTAVRLQDIVVCKMLFVSD